MTLVETFLVMQEYMTVDQMLEQCKIEWDRNWVHQPPSLRGSPAAEGRYGIENTVAIENFYYANGMKSSPLVGFPRDVPDSEFVVSTRHSTYRFGNADLQGERTVQREPVGLDFGRCILQTVAIVGKAMPIGRLDGSGSVWWTTPSTGLREAETQ